MKAGVVRVEIDKRKPIDGDFGEAGAYELVSGRYFGEIDPDDPHNAIITDLSLVPRNGRNRVEYSATFTIARPVDMEKASGVLIYDVVNRGFGLDLYSVRNPIFGTAVGDRDGHIHVISGWQGDITPAPFLQTIAIPVARNRDGSPITGSVLIRVVNPPAGATTVALSQWIGGTATNYKPASLDTSKARLILRRSDDGAGEIVPTDEWSFGDCHEAVFPGKPDHRCLSLKAGFDPACVYELIYTAKDPLVLGIGYVAVRDLVSFLRYEAGTEIAPNPIGGKIHSVIATGASQSGNFLRSFIHLGFNQTLSEKIVFDGANVLVAGRHALLGVRFGFPGGAAAPYEPGSEGVLWWDHHEDAFRGRPALGLLDRCRASDTCPKIFEMFGSAEIWGLRMSPNLVGLDASHDIPLPPNVRRYYFPGVTHGGGAGGFDTTSPTEGLCLLPVNPNPIRDSMRALFKAMVAWVVENKSPPPSRYPTLAAGDLVPPNARSMGYPEIPGQPAPDGNLNPMTVYDFGPRFRNEDESGVMDNVPPSIVQIAPGLVPRVDADGNETSGIASVQLRVPIGTYLGWNVQASGYYAGRAYGFSGGYIPFAATKSERLEKGDPRLSLVERYGSHANFVAKVRDAAEQISKEGFLLPEDKQRIVDEAEASTILK